MSHKLLEVACFDPEACLQAAQASADRIEFCADYACGGVTPAREDIARVRALVAIRLHVIIRPRGGDFVYSAEEKAVMRADIEYCRNVGVDGVVFGALDPSQGVDLAACAGFMELAAGMATTFHRAIDVCPDMEAALERLVALGVTNVLSSGGKPTAVEGAARLRALHARFGEALTIMPGGGIRSHNIRQLIAETRCRAYHTAAITGREAQLDPEELRVILESIRAA